MISNKFCVIFSLFAIILGISFSACAEDLPKSTFMLEEQLSQLDQQVRRARIYVQIGKNEQALPLLRTAASQSWNVLFNAGGAEFVTNQNPIPANGNLGRAARLAADAHYWWGVAARNSGSHDEEISAFARAARLSANDNSRTSRTNITTALSNAIKRGFPQSAAPDVLADIAKYAHQEKWQLKSTFSEELKSTFLYTSGDLDAAPTLPKTAPLYKNIPEEKLPQELTAPHAFYAYQLPSGKGLAQLQIIVRYNGAQYQELAEKLARELVKIKSANDDFLNESLPPITLWLETVAADWPKQPSDDSPWEAAAKLDSAPHDIMVFRIDKVRSDAEWFRELQHEYGHVAWPNFSAFSPPLEPNANGLIAETLGVVWQARKSGINFSKHIEKNALESLHFWAEQGADSTLSAGNNADARRYLQGLCVYVERVYGEKVLSEILQKLAGGNNDARAILSLLPYVSKQMAAQKSLFIYLPAANVRNLPNVDFFVERAAINYPPNEVQEFLLYIPENAVELRISWQGEGEILYKSTFGTAKLESKQLIVELGGVSGWQKLRLEVRGGAALGMAQMQ